MGQKRNLARFPAGQPLGAKRNMIVFPTKWQKLWQRARTIRNHFIIGAIIGAGTAALTHAAIKNWVPPKNFAGQAVARRVFLPKTFGVQFPVASSKMSVLLRQGAPFLHAKQIDAELEKRNSPAAGCGFAFEKYGKFFGIMPEIGLVFFRNESAWGTKGSAVENKSIGNIAYSRWSGSSVKYENNNGFRKYAGWEDGIKDFFWLLSSKKYAGGWRKTLKKIIPAYAPKAHGNNPEKYAADAVSYLNELYGHKSKKTTTKK